jgi:hypothetical protein
MGDLYFASNLATNEIHVLAHNIVHLEFFSLDGLMRMT